MEGRLCFIKDVFRVAKINLFFKKLLVINVLSS